MSRRKKEKKNADRTAARRYSGSNPLYPEKQESDVKGVLTALASVAGAIAFLAVIVMNFSYYAHPERLEGQTQASAQTAAEAGETEAAQTAEENSSYTGQEAVKAEDISISAGQGEQTAEAPAGTMPAETAPEPSAESVPVTAGADMSDMPQDIETIEGTGVSAGAPDGGEMTSAAQPGTEQSVQPGSEQPMQPEAEQSAQSGAVPGPEDTQIFADSSRRYLTDGEVSGLSQADIQTAINEVFARHGYIFETQEIADHFRQYDWYEPTVSKDLFDTSVFNDYETANVELLSRYRQ